MSHRFPIFLIVLLAGLGLCAIGLFGEGYPVYKKLAPEDEAKPEEVERDLIGMIKELEFTDMVSRERVALDVVGLLIDTETEAACYS